MPPPTLTPPRNPDQSSTFQVDSKVLTAAFGDGYSQRAPDGLNTIRNKATVVFRGLTQAEFDSLATFLREMRGATAFYYTLPPETSPRLWTAKTWNWTTPAGTYYDLSIDLEEQFDVV